MLTAHAFVRLIPLIRSPISNIIRSADQRLNIVVTYLFKTSDPLSCSTLAAR